MSCLIVLFFSLSVSGFPLDGRPVPPAFFSSPPLDGGAALLFVHDLRSWHAAKEAHDKVFYARALVAIEALSLTALDELLTGVDDPVAGLKHLEKYAGSDHLDGDTLRALDGRVAKHMKLFVGRAPAQKVATLLQVLAAASVPDRHARDDPSAPGTHGAEDPSAGLVSRLLALSLEQSISSALALIQPSTHPTSVLYLIACTGNLQAILATRHTTRQLERAPAPFLIAAHAWAAAEPFLSHVIVYGDGLTFARCADGDWDAMIDADHHERLPTTIPAPLLAKLATRNLGALTAADLLFVIAAASESRLSVSTRHVKSLDDRLAFYDWLDLLLTTWAPLLRALGFDALHEERGFPALIAEIRAYMSAEPGVGHQFAVQAVLAALSAAGLRWALVKESTTVSQLPAVYDPYDTGAAEIRRLLAHHDEARAARRRSRALAAMHHGAIPRAHPTAPPHVPPAPPAPPAPPPPPAGKGGGKGATGAYGAAAFPVGPQAGTFRVTPGHYELDGLFFNRAGATGIDSVLTAAGCPPTDPLTGAHKINVAYLLVGSSTHIVRLQYCTPAIRPVSGRGLYPPSWFSSKLAKPAIDHARSLRGKPAGWQVPLYFR